MTYEEAKNISQYLEGAIKCTYVRFYYDFGGKGNPDDIKHLFSLQHKDIGKNGFYCDNMQVAPYEHIWDKFNGLNSAASTIDHQWGDPTIPIMDLWENEIGEFREPIVEIRPRFAKEIAWGRKRPNTLVRVNVEASVLKGLVDKVENYAKKSTGRDFTYVTDRILDTNNLYVKANTINWNPTGTDVIDAVIEEEEEIISEEQKAQSKKKNRKLLLLALASLIFNN